MRFRLGYDSGGSPPLAQLDPLTVDEMLTAADRLGGRSVFWIGDSIVWSGSDIGVTGPELLERELRSRYGNDIHVINAALPAARTADKYAILLRVLEHRPALIIYESKYLEFSRAQVETVTFRYPYLNDVVAVDPEYAAHVHDFPETRPALLPPMSHEQFLVDNALRHVLSVVRYQALLQQLMFQGDLYGRLGGAQAQPEPPTLAVTGVTGGNGTPTQPTGTPNPAARLPENFTPAYRSGPFDAFSNAGLFFARRVANTLDNTKVPAVAYLAAVNHSLVGSLADDPLFRSNLGIVEQTFGGHQFPFSDYQDALPNDSQFLDTEHLSLSGHLAMIQRLIADHGVLLDRALGSSP